VGAPSGLRLRGKEPYRRLPIEFAYEVAIIFRDRKQPATRNRRAAGRGAMEFALRALHGCPVDRKHFSHFTNERGKCREISNGANNITRRCGRNCNLLRWFTTQTSRVRAVARPVALALALMTPLVSSFELSRAATGSPHRVKKKNLSRGFVQPSTLAHGSAKKPIHLAE
jgi:hypothetical protein